ncbi:hypothetical protein MMC15_008309 [Xylographa vitiligo]|nr:hypothetical protein [Xylographa vitiligo]
MSILIPRNRASTVTYTESEATELQGQLEKLPFSLTTADRPQWLQQLHAPIEASQTICQLFRANASPNRIRDAFRHLNGFQILIEALRSTSQSIRLSQITKSEVEAILDVYQNLWALLTAALQDHWGNRKYFRKRVEGGGWETLQQILKEMLRDHTFEYLRQVTERLFGCLFACALEDETLNRLFSQLARHREDDNGGKIEHSTHKPADPELAKEEREGDRDDIGFIKQALGTQAFLHNPEAVAIATQLWLLEWSEPADECHVATAVSLVLPAVIDRIADIKTHNLVALHAAGVLKLILHAFVNGPLNENQQRQLRDLATVLLTLGVTDLNDAHFLYRHASTSKEVAELLQIAFQKSSIPPCIHFDLSTHGFASVELSDIGRTFPPVNSSSGYTLSMWLQVVDFDPESHTTLFGAFDSSQSCFVLIYLEKDTRNLILQTSVTASRPSVRFKSFVFDAGRWYHLCVVHRRPKTTTSSRASLFIDGEFVEQVKAQYPAPPPLALTLADNADVLSPGRKHRPVQAFLGTPQDLASRIGQGLVSSRWRLASAYLFNDTLSDDLIAVHMQLGPRYHGNYQDCLGSFQTYRASAALNLRNESLHPGREDKSEIVTAIRSKASALLPESRVILNFSPMMVLDDDDRNNVDETQLIKSLSKNAAKNMRTVTRNGRNAIIINGAIPSVNEALTHSYGFAVLTGEPVIVIPQSLDDASWRIGGCAPVGLALVESASSPQNLICALEILLGTIQDSWRNSEAMERENGFGVLASLLTAKLDNIHTGLKMQNLHINVTETEAEALSFEILSIILKFIGYQERSLADSVINNPLAYRILIVDLDIWRTSSPKVQKLYYEQFETFSTGSKHHHFNTKRLGRMRILKKWLDSLKTGVFYTETFEYMIAAFRSLLTLAPSTDSLRSLALYITYAVNAPKEETAHLLRSSRTIRLPQHSFNPPQRRSTTASSSPRIGFGGYDEKPVMTRLEIGIRILDMYADLLCQKDLNNIKKFARTVTNKWLLNLLSDENSKIVTLTMKILARVLITNGSSYVEKFTEKTGGFVIMKYRLKRWWNITALWPLCFAILFGKDVANVDFERPFDLYNLLTIFASNNTTKVVNPQVLPVIAAMLQNGLKSITKDQDDPDSPLMEKSNGSNNNMQRNDKKPIHGRVRSMSLQAGPGSLREDNTRTQRLDESAKTLHTVTRFLADMHSNAQGFRDFTITSPYIQELLFLLFPIIVSSDIVGPETELYSRDSSLTFNGNDVIIRPLSQMSMKAAPIVRTALVEPPLSPKATKAQPLKRGSSYILVTSEQSEYQPSSARLQSIISPKGKRREPLNVSNSLVEEILEIIIAVFSDQIFARKDFPGIGLFMKVPPGFQEHQAYFESFILRNTLLSLSNTIQLEQKLLWEPRVLTNLARFATHLGEAVYEGWFIDGADIVLDFLGGILEYLQRPDITQLKSVRLCSEVIAGIRTVVSRIVLLRLSEMDDSRAQSNTVAFLNKVTYWQSVLFGQQASQEEFLKLLCYLLYTKLVSPNEPVREAAANIWRTLLLQKPDEATGVLCRMMSTENKHLSRGFQKILELDNASFLEWVDDHRVDLDAIFFGNLAAHWEDFVKAENRRTEESAKARILKRRERLKIWVSEDQNKEDVIRRHEVSSDHWRSNIYASEHLKRQRSIQDQQDLLNFNLSSWNTMVQQLHRPCGVFDDTAPLKWQLDQTEGRNRMRMRMMRDKEAHLYNYHAKANIAKNGKPQKLLLDVRVKTLSKSSATILPSPIVLAGTPVGDSPLPFSSPAVTMTSDELPEVEDGFEMVEEPNDGLEGYEDKNRKVMRSLQRGDQVEHVHNISRIRGLEACEGLLILGKNALYLLDNFFQRSDGEIVDVWQAPQEERDSYMQMISGREVGAQTLNPSNLDHKTRSWPWEDILSISKRRFLFRDVAIEVFFVDGQSYLLTIVSPKLRDALYQHLCSRAQSALDHAPAASLENLWRLESLRTPEDSPQTLGSRFTNVFSHGLSNPATRKWMKGEMSNFHYLMLVNTMAGRTFNDLTQYPVFPWVLADYTSEELDLTNPRSFRDLTKPMGCQTPERQAEFRDRYQSFAEMGDHNSPPFHYGTHYSSAMIVTSYLIRLQPFVKSYLLLQGGSFDHPDRLFYSIERAWASASRENMTDVRELIPEFYYLPDFLLNSNGYDFGSRQGTGGTIDTVVLPPWAKGDPKVFIAKHREALESDYVSQHLHQWIDLIFGHKQRGEAALEATNVFHHLSYRGAKNLDEINDPVERLATIGIIHNFGQTPHQVFQRAHPQREDLRHKQKRLDTLADTLTRLPFPLLKSEDRISSILYFTKQDRLLCSGALRLNIPPSYDKYMEWGFVDGSIRFYASDSKKLIGMFEHIHQGQLSSALFVDSRSLVTAGSDCTISVWQVVHAPKSVDLNPKACLFGHRAPVTVLATSRSFSTLLSASSDGHVILWDLNRLDLVRVLTQGAQVECACINDVSGTIMLCRGPEVALFTLNGDLLLEQNVCAEGDEVITSCAFYEGAGNEYIEQNLVFTGHRRGVVNIWKMSIHRGSFVLDHVKRLNHLDQAGFNVTAAITSLLPMPLVLYTGDDDGRVVSVIPSNQKYTLLTVVTSASGTLSSVHDRLSTTKATCLALAAAEDVGVPVYARHAFENHQFGRY